MLKHCLSLLVTVLPFSLFSQLQVDEPVIIPPELLIYISKEGLNTNNGDSLNPVADFITALQRVKDSTNGRTGDVYAELVFYSGTYGQILAQPLAFYLVENRRLNIGLRGKGEVVLDERLIPGSAANAMIHLLGSNIAVKQLKIAYCAGAGTRFGLVWNGNEIIPHDILLQNVVLEGSGGHGLHAGLGRFASSNQQNTSLPYTQRVLFENCTVSNSVNHNDMSKTSWGSAFKFHYVKHGIVRNCVAYNNAGEGIDLDDCNTVLIEKSESYDNRASVYFDKSENIIFRNNLIYNVNRSQIGLLLGTEVSYAFVSNYYLRNIYIYNNLFLNVPCAISYWMGTVSATQNSILQNVQICNNTLIGKRKSNQGILNFSYEKNPFNPNAPASNVQIANIRWQGNIVSFSNDSTGKVFTAPISPQPGLSTQNNLYHYRPESNFNSANDSINAALPRTAYTDSLQHLIPALHRETTFLLDGPLPSYLANDFFGRARRVGTSQIGAIEFETVPYVLDESRLNACDSLTTATGEVIYTSQSRTDTLMGFFQDTLRTQHYEISKSSHALKKFSACTYITWKELIFYNDTLLIDSLQSTAGCDSILVYEFSIETPFVKLEKLNDTLFVRFIGDSLLWKNCHTGETWKDSLGFVTVSGAYMATAWLNGCPDSSACLQISSTTSINTNLAKACPSFSNGQIALKELPKLGTWKLMNLQGQGILQWQDIYPTTHLAKGLYLLVNEELSHCGTYKVYLNE